VTPGPTWRRDARVRLGRPPRDSGDVTGPVEVRVDAVIFIVHPLDAHPHNPDIRDPSQNLQPA